MGELDYEVNDEQQRGPRGESAPEKSSPAANSTGRTGETDERAERSLPPRADAFRTAPTEDSAKVLTRGEYADRVRAAPPVGIHDRDSWPSDFYASSGDQPGEPVARVAVVSVDRTWADTTPTGVGRKPTGAELLDTADDSASRLERLRNKYCESADDIDDSFKESSSDLHDFFASRQPSGHAETQLPNASAASLYHPKADSPSVVTAGLVTGLLISQGVRWLQNVVERRKESSDARDR
jgi:hypothetical protein